MDSNSGAIINPRFCARYPIDLAFTTKPPGDKKNGNLATVDAAGNILFRAKDSWNGSIQLRDAVGHNTVLTMKAKFWSLHSRWRAFRGDSKKAKDIVFSVKRSSYFQFRDEWFVYLAGNTKEENCDFRIVGSYRKKNYTIYRGDSTFVVAQLTENHKLNLPLKKHTFGATISANCDYSFVAALIVIFQEVYSKNINNDDAHMMAMQQQAHMAAAHEAANMATLNAANMATLNAAHMMHT